MRCARMGSTLWGGLLRKAHAGRLCASRQLCCAWQQEFKHSQVQHGGMVNASFLASAVVSVMQRRHERRKHSDISRPLQMCKSPMAKTRAQTR